jgi:hypothetical protein
MRTLTLEFKAIGHAVARGQVSRLPAVFAGLVVVVLAFAGAAEAAGPGSGAQTPGGLTGVLGQVSPQPSQTAQAAVAQAAAAQVQPVNIAITIAVNSPGASPVIVQSNGNSGGAGAGNSSSTQSSGKPQQTDSKGSSAPSLGQSGNGSGRGGDGPSHQAPQSSQTVQGAGAQAVAVQIHPANLTAPIAVNSPGASPVIVQTNGNSAGATAGNSSSTTQSSGVLQPPGTAANSQPPPPPAQAGPLPPIGIPGIDFAALNSLLGPGSGWTSNWNWNWSWNLELDIPWPRLPALPEWPSPGPSSGNDPVPAPKGDRVNAGRPVGAHGETGGWEPSSGLESGPGLSATFVQSPANEAEPSLTPLVPLPLPALPSSPSGGAGISPAGLILGALAALTLYLISLGLLLRRLGLASAPWRHQAYLAPLQRPG